MLKLRFLKLRRVSISMPPNQREVVAWIMMVMRIVRIFYFTGMKPAINRLCCWLRQWLINKLCQRTYAANNRTHEPTDATPKNHVDNATSAKFIEDFPFVP